MRNHLTFWVSPRRRGALVTITLHFLLTKGQGTDEFRHERGIACAIETMAGTGLAQGVRSRHMNRFSPWSKKIQRFLSATMSFTPASFQTSDRSSSAIAIGGSIGEWPSAARILQERFRSTIRSTNF